MLISILGIKGRVLDTGIPLLDTQDLLQGIPDQPQEKRNQDIGNPSLMTGGPNPEEDLDLLVKRDIEGKGQCLLEEN